MTAVIIISAILIVYFFKDVIQNFADDVNARNQHHLDADKKWQHLLDEEKAKALNNSKRAAEHLDRAIKEAETFKKTSTKSFDEVMNSFK